MRIELDRIRRTFGDRNAVDDLTLTIGSGELCVLLGPSGCGKSTTLRCIAGLESVDAGSIRFDGVPVDQRDPVERDVAMVFQNYALYPHMTVAANIAFPLKMRRTDRTTTARRVREVAASLGLDELLARRPRQLSGGQQQRVALARALVRDPKVFLFDEPLSNLDAKLRVELRAEIRELHRRLGTTMVYVTHDQAEAMVLADRIAVLDGGRLQQEGAPTEVFDRPATRFVAGFLGSPPMRFARLRVVDGCAAFLGCVLRLDATGLVEVGIRPHRLRAGLTGACRARGTVRAIELHGHETLVHVEAEGHELLAWGEGHLREAPGATIELSFDRGDLHVFGADGARIEPSG